MRTPTLAVVSAAVLFALAGCGQAAESGADSPAASTTSAPADPAAQVAAAATKLETGSFTFAVKSPVGTMAGVQHTPSNSLQVTASGKDEDGSEIKMEFVEIGDDRWMKIDFGQAAEDDPVMQGVADGLRGWRHVTKEEAQSTGSLAQERIGALGASILKGTTGLKETTPGTFTGALDATANPVIDLIGDAEELKAVAAAKAMPVTITLDPEGRVTAIAFDVPAAGKTAAGKATITFADFDEVEQPKAPPADQVQKN